jgi:hypothetical protein
VHVGQVGGTLGLVTQVSVDVEILGIFEEPGKGLSVVALGVVDTTHFELATVRDDKAKAVRVDEAGRL